MKKLCAGIFAVFVSIAVFIECEGRARTATAGAGDKEPVSFTIVYAVGNQLTAELHHTRVTEYMRLHPHVTIIEKLGNEGAYLDSIRLLDAVGELPDLLEMRNTRLFSQTGKIGALPADIIDLFESTVSFGGKVYAAPIDEAYPSGIVYSKKIFDRLGIAVPDIKTYDDFLAVCDRIKVAGIAPIVVGGADIWQIGFWWNYFWHQEVALNDPDWMAHRYEGKVHFTDPDVRAAVTGLVEIFRKGYVEKSWASTGESQCPSILVNGQAAMYFIGPFAFQQIEDADPEFEYGFFAVPDKNGKYNISGGSTANGWSINAETQKDPAKAEEVYNYIRYFFSDAVYADYLSRANAFSTLKHKIDYEAGEHFREVQRIIETADNRQLAWNDKPGLNEQPLYFREFCYRLAEEWFLDASTIEDGLRAMDEKWDALAEEFNPIRGRQ